MGFDDVPKVNDVGFGQTSYRGICHFDRVYELLLSKLNLKLVFFLLDRLALWVLLMELPLSLQHTLVLTSLIESHYPTILKCRDLTRQEVIRPIISFLVDVLVRDHIRRVDLGD